MYSFERSIFQFTLTYFSFTIVLELKRYFEAAESAAKEILLEEIKPKLGLGVHVGEFIMLFFSVYCVYLDCLCGCAAMLCASILYIAWYVRKCLRCVCLWFVFDIHSFESVASVILTCLLSDSIVQLGIYCASLNVSF